MSTDQARIDRLAEAAPRRVRPDPASRCALINVSENWTYRIEEPGGRRLALRVHRPGYHTAAEIASELDWIDALREDGVVETAHAVPRHRRQPRAARSRRHELGERNVVLFDWLSGEMPDARCRRPAGRASARWAQSRRACTATREAGGRRPGSSASRWDYDTTLAQCRPLGPVAGRARHGRRGSARLLGRLDDVLRRRLEAFGLGPSASASSTPTSGWRTCSWTATHVRVIDFDDCGWSWFMYDFATHRVVHRGPSATCPS